MRASKWRLSLVAASGLIYEVRRHCDTSWNEEVSLRQSRGETALMLFIVSTAKRWTRSLDRVSGTVIPARKGADRSSAANAKPIRS